MDFPLKFQPSSSPLLTPTNVAILTSVGLHAVVLGFMLPYFSDWSNSNPNSNKQNVGVIELTDGEQSRLPDTSPFPNSGAFPGGTSVLPNNALPTDPLAGNPSINNLPPIAQSPLPNSDFNSQIPLPPLPAFPPLPDLPPLSSSLPRLPGYNNLNNIPITQSPVSLPPLRPSYRTSTRSSLPPLSNPPSYFDSIRDRQNNNGNTPVRPRFSELPPTRGTGFMDNAPQNAMGSNLPPQPLLQADTKETTSEQAMRNDLEWRAKQASQPDSNVNNIGTVNLIGTYPRAACSTKTEGRVVYNVMPSGEVTPIQTSRYSLFNQLALQSVQSQRFSQPTRAIIDFKYDPKVCAGTVITPTLPAENPGSQPRLPGINPSETVSPINDPTRDVPQLRPLTPGSNTVPLPSEQNTRQNVSPIPPRILQPNSPAIPTQPAIAPSPVVTPSAVIKTQPSEPPNNPSNSTEYGPSQLGTPKTPTEVKPENKPETPSTPDTPVQNNTTTPIKAQPEPKPSSTPKPEVTPSPVSEQSPLEKIRSRFFPPQQPTKKEEPSSSKPINKSSETNSSIDGQPAPTSENNLVGPSVGKKSN